MFVGLCVCVCSSRSRKVIVRFGSSFRENDRSRLEEHMGNIKCGYGAAVLRQERVFERGSRFTALFTNIIR